MASLILISSTPYLCCFRDFTFPSLPPLPLSLCSRRKDQKYGFPSYRHPRALSFRCNAQFLPGLAAAPAAAAAYGTLLLGGGLFAYSRLGSKGSILGGVSGAALMGIAYYLMQTPETEGIGEAIGFGSAFIFSCIFGIRLAATRKVIPSGILLGVSLGALAFFFSAYSQTKV